MANWFQQLFGGGAGKQQTYPEVKFQTPQQTEAGKYALPLLKSRAAGEGVAFTPDMLSMYGQPYAQAAQNQYNTYAQPAIEETFASKGLGRSTMAGQAEVQGQKDLADLIGVNWSELNKWNEAMKQQGIQNAMGGLENYTAQELAQANMNAQQEVNRALGQNAYNQQYEIAQSQAIPRALQAAGQVAGIVAAPFTGGASLGATFGTALQDLLQRSGAGGGGGITPTQRSAISPLVNFAPMVNRYFPNNTYNPYSRM